uniref:Myb-like domain-containing protein n=1 Tax=Solanum lycopersicum TaxID=4081 RepID=K4B595_SOLLC|nr:trihelix transcription factor ASR3-like [Solanum lycopersicum]
MDSSSSMLRDYRKGNWTIQETMVLIEAKKMDDERRMKRQGGDIGNSSSSERGNINKPGELRWKWVEDYCWRHGCLRSQNQCNDKWDNLMRDFKKVREYERRVSEKLLLAQGNDDENVIKSYWKIERIERKEKNLPTNMLPEIYEALVQVVDKRGQKMLVGSSFNPTTTSMSPTLQQLQIATFPLPLPPPPQLLPPRPPLVQPPPPNIPPTQPLPTMCDSSDHDKSEHSDSPAKRRRKGKGGEASGTSGDHHNINNLQEVGSAIFRSATIIAKTIKASEEGEDRRHNEMLKLHERRLQIEESKAEINRQGINGLVDSINRLANSILSLASNNNQPPPPK